jgi:hypothetical protein
MQMSTFIVLPRFLWFFDIKNILCFIFPTFLKQPIPITLILEQSLMFLYSFVSLGGLIFQLKLKAICHVCPQQNSQAIGILAKLGTFVYSSKKVFKLNCAAI